MADIEFTSEIKVDTKEAQKSIADLSKQVESVFQRTSDMMAKAIKTNNFGFAQYTSNYTGGIKELNKILQDYEAAIPSPEGLKGGAVAARNRKIRQLDIAGGQINKLQNLSNFMDKLSQYDTLYNDVVSLRKSVVGGTIESEKALGRYNVKQRFSNNLLGLLYAYRRAYPGIVTEDALEISEKHRDRNRKTGAQSRSELRYTQDKEYWQKAYARARNYMLLDSGDTMLDQLNEIYGMGMEPTVKTKPGSVNQKAKDLLTVWADKGISAQRHKEALESGNLGKADKAYHFAEYKKDMSAFIKLQQKLFPEEKAIAENLKKLNQADILKFKETGTTGWLKAGAATAWATKLLSDGIQMIESGLGERVTRNAYASRQAYYKRWEIGGQAGGLAGGAAIGAALGSIIPGVGTAIGAGIGSALGGVLGPIFGKWMGIQNQANIVSADRMAGRVRNRALYGAGYNSSFALAMDSIGVGAGGMQELAGDAMTFRARMMTGQVGEMDMFYYSMMPNYFAAKMAGVTGPQLAKIYQSDLNGISDPSMRALVGQSVGGQNAFAMVNNPYFGAHYNSALTSSRKYERLAAMLMPGYMRGRNKKATEDMGQDMQEIVRTAASEDELFFNDRNVFVRGQNKSLGRDLLLGLVGGIFGVPGTGLSKLAEGIEDQRDLAKATTTFVNIINLDGEEIKRDVKSADEIYMDSWSQYSGG